MKGLLCTTEEVQAIQDDRKTQKRLPIKRAKGPHFFGLCTSSTGKERVGKYGFGEDGKVLSYCKPPYQVGDILYVRETWSTLDDSPYDNYVYRTDYGITEDDSFPPSMFKWRSPARMPKEAARIFLRVTGVRVERVQDISEDDAFSEGAGETELYNEAEHYSIGGINIKEGSPAQCAFAGLWDDLHAKKGYGWDVNPWAWVYEFEQIDLKKENAYMEYQLSCLR